MGSGGQHLLPNLRQTIITLKKLLTSADVFTFFSRGFSLSIPIKKKCSCGELKYGA